MNINDLIKEAHEIAVEKGFYDCPDCDKMKIEICPSCRGSGINRNRNISELLMLIVSELGEAQEALRHNYFTPAHIWGKIYAPVFTTMIFEQYVKNSVEDELADVFIRLGDLCGYLNIDIEKHIKAKMEYNKGRPRKHGKKF